MKIKLILNILKWLALATYLIIAMNFVFKQRNNVTCGNLDINIDKTHNFINEDTIKNILIANEINITNQKSETINYNQIKKTVEQNTMIKNVNAYRNYNGDVFIDVKQKNPIMRIITKDNKSYYIDEDYQKLPTSNVYSANVIVVNGDITDNFINGIDTMSYSFTPNMLYDFVQKINNDDLWKNQIVQIYINENKEIELIPRIGNQIILFGNLNDDQKKLNKLEALYKTFTTDDWNKYATINLMYTDRIYCKKRD